MEPTNADIRADFRLHAKEDHKFQDETRKTDQSILDSLQAVHDKLETLVDQIAHQGERFDCIETNMKPILELYEGLRFGSGALKWTSGIVLAITVIAGSAMAFVKFLKG